MTQQIVSVRTYALTAIALFVLLALTLVAAEAHLGPWSVAVAMAIAIAKATLVAMFFMHLKHAEGITRIFAGIGILWMLILMAGTLSDILTRGWMRIEWP